MTYFIHASIALVLFFTLLSILVPLSDRLEAWWKERRGRRTVRIGVFEADRRMLK